MGVADEGEVVVCCGVDSRTIDRRVESGDDEVWRPTDRDSGDDASSGNIEHKYLTVGECYKAKLSIAGNGDRLRGTAQRDYPRWFLW